MSWNGSIVNVEAARRASQTVLLAESLGLIVDADLTSLAAAQAAVDAAEALKPITGRIYAAQIKKALALGKAFGASVTGASLAAFYDALPDNFGNKRRLFN